MKYLAQVLWGKGERLRSDNKLFAPFAGTVVMIAPTKHSIGLRSDTGGLSFTCAYGFRYSDIRWKAFYVTCRRWQ
nr:PTS glucose transporter subunit IIA [Halalkalibacter alkalisediminis]